MPQCHTAQCPLSLYPLFSPVEIIGGRGQRPTLDSHQLSLNPYGEYHYPEQSQPRNHHGSCFAWIFSQPICHMESAIRIFFHFIIIRPCTSRVENLYPLSDWLWRICGTAQCVTYSERPTKSSYSVFRIQWYLQLRAVS